MPENITLENPIAIIGGEDIVLGFKALGLKAYPLKANEDFKIIFDKITEENLSICLVQENIYLANIDYINNYRHLALPIILPFSKDAKANLIDKLIRGIRLKATGRF